MRRRMPGFGCLAGLLVVYASGCADPDPIRQYQVAKPVPDDSFIPSPGTPVEAAPRKSAWFFKLQGPDDAVASQVEPFTQLVSSVRFGSDGNPQWSLPAGWTEQRESGMRFATIKSAGDPPLEISVMALPAEDPDSTEDLLSNLNRWRGQLGLGDINATDGLAAARDRGELLQLDSGGRKVSLFNLTGTTADTGETRMLAAMLVSEPGRTTAPPPTRPAPSAAEKPFTFSLPDGWKEAPLRTFQLAAFAAEHGGETLSISIATAGGDLAGNVNRWRGQAGLPPQSEEEINDSAKPIDVDGVPAKYFVVEGAERSILGIIAPRAGTQWFIKADGPKAVAEKERGNFEAFVKSLRFKS